MASPLPHTIGQATHVGLHRTENQDSYGRFPKEQDGREQLFVVADGMGGHRGGREASQIAIHTIEEAFFSNRHGTVQDRLRRALAAANGAIVAQARQDAQLEGMGTTCTALLLFGRRAVIAHVGDSRAYRVVEGRIERLTRDHTRVEDMVRQNILTPEEAATHPNRNVLSRALGAGTDVEVDVSEVFAPRPGESYLLCSDGLAYVDDAEVRTIVEECSPQTACDRLVQRANEAGGYDNVTVQIVHIDEPLPPSPSTRRRRMAAGAGAFILLLLTIWAIMAWT